MKKIIKKILQKILPKYLYDFLSFYVVRNQPNVVITEKMLWLYRWRKPIKPYAFIRVHNEIKTIDACLKSILPIVKGGVIGFHYSDEADDGTIAYVKAFCEKYPQFSWAEYPHKVLPPLDLRYKDKDLDIRKRLDSYYNFVWDKLPKNEWVVKIDCDHIYIRHHFENLCRLPLKKNQAVLLSRLNLHIHQNQVYTFKKFPIQEPGDHWLLYNGKNIPTSPFFFHFINDGIVFGAREGFKEVWKNYRIYSIASNWHFPWIKTWRSHFHLNDFILLKDSGLSGGGGYKYCAKNLKIVFLPI